jgi:hypothetical protein
MRPLTRIEPAMPPQAYKTYQLVSPRDVLVKTACEQVACPAWLNGWESPIDEATDLGRAQAAYIRQQSGRTFAELRTQAGLTVFRFASRQRCFADHQTRPETYLVTRGDWRSEFDLIRRHTRPVDWVDDFAEHQQTLADRLERG